MNIKLFGNRVVLEHYKLNTKSSIIIPATATLEDTHRTGIVRYVGDGRVRGKDKLVPPLVNVGDVVVFQANDVILRSQAFVRDGKHYLTINQDDLIARIKNDEITVDNLDILGDYVLLRPCQRATSILIPESSIKNPEWIYFKCVKNGTTIDIDIKPGDEVLANLFKLTPFYICTRDKSGTLVNEEYAYTRKEWIDGVIEVSSLD